jgi:hypothetical protein
MRRKLYTVAKHFCSYFPSDFLHAAKSYDVGLTAIFPSEGTRATDFIALKIHRLGRI